MSDGTPKQAPSGAPARVIDLDQKRAARAEARGEPVTVKFGGKTFDLPPELSVEFAERATEGKLTLAFTNLFGKQAEDFFACDPSVDDLNELAESIKELYGIDAGEAPASQGS